MKWLSQALGERGVIACVGLAILSVSLSFIDWRVAGVVLGGILVSITIVPLLFRKDGR